jgi:hypothetical protein
LLFACVAALAAAMPLARVLAQQVPDADTGRPESQAASPANESGPLPPAAEPSTSAAPGAGPSASPAPVADPPSALSAETPEPTTPSEDSTEPSEPSIIANEDVVDMTKAGFAESTILGAIAANDSHFDVSPHALMALKDEGVSQSVIEAMLDVEAANKKAAAIAQKAAAQTTNAPPPAEIVRLSKMIEQLAAKQDAAAAAQRAPEPPKNAEPTPHAWVLKDDNRLPLPPTIAQVAFTDDKSAERFKTLQSLAGTALVFVNPAVGGIATTLGGLFHPGSQEHTAIWALTGTAAPRDLGVSPTFEVEFGHIPGVDPDQYQPAIVRLVPTKDNYRLIAAAKTAAAKSGAPPDGPIIEEPVVTQLKQLGRGHYRAAATMLPTGEYALVLRPVDRDERGRRKRRKSEASLGELLGGRSSTSPGTSESEIARRSPRRRGTVPPAVA